MKQNSYQKLKAENAQLKEDIYNLIKNENKLDGLAVRFKYETLFGMEDVIMAGRSTNYSLDPYSSTSGSK